MKHLLIGTALLIACGGAAAQPPLKGMEEDYDGWRSFGLDQRLGTAFFVGAQKRSGSAALYHILKVYRNAIGGAHKFDKEVMQMLADCGSRKVLMTDHRHQLGDAIMPPMITVVLPPEAPKPGSVEDAALKAVCGDGLEAIPIVERPYSWAKARLRGGGVQR